jgi:hypothetical protein
MTEVLDLRVLAELTEEVGEAAARRFLDSFGAALEGRVSRLAAAALDGLAFETYEAATNLAAASAMVGAGPLAGTARSMACDAARTGTLPTPEMLRVLERLAAATATELARHGHAAAGGSGPTPRRSGRQAPSNR